MRRIALLSLFALLLCAPGLARAQGAPAARIAALRGLFATPATAGTFSAEAKATDEDVRRVNDAVKGLGIALGPLTNVAEDGSQFALTFARGTAHATLELDAQGKISDVHFRDAMGPALTAALERVMRADKIDPAWFSPAFLEHVTPAMLASTFAELHARFGAFRSVEQTAAGYVCALDKGRFSAQIMFAGDGKIYVFQLHPV